jgi:hypothetical protein
MKIRLKAPEGLNSTGIYGKNGVEMPVGHEMDVAEEPKGWAGRFDVLSKGDKEGKTAVVNPAKSTKKPDAGDDEQPKTPAEVLAMGSNSEVQFMTFKSAATKLLGDKTPSTKADILTALEELATQP